jgi:hypothetical protein
MRELLALCLGRVVRVIADDDESISDADDP